MIYIKLVNTKGLIGDLLGIQNCLNNYIVLDYDETYSIAGKVEQISNMLCCGLISKSKARKLLGFK